MPGRGGGRGLPQALLGRLGGRGGGRGAPGGRGPPPAAALAAARAAAAAREAQAKVTVASQSKEAAAAEQQGQQAQPAQQQQDGEEQSQPQPQQEQPQQAQAQVQAPQPVVAAAHLISHSSLDAGAGTVGVTAEDPYAAAAAAIVEAELNPAPQTAAPAPSAAAPLEAAAALSAEQPSTAQTSAGPTALEEGATLGASHVEGIALAHKVHLTYEQQALGGRFYRVGRGGRAQRAPRQAVAAREEPRRAKAARLAWLSDVVENVSRLSAVGTRFAQGLLGGFALLNLYMSYLYDGGGSFVSYYSPLANSASSTYHVLGTVALLGALDRHFRARTAGFPRGLSQANASRALVAIYLLAFVLTLVCSPFEEQLYYSQQRVPQWWELYPETDSFKSKKSAYLALNFFRVVLFGLGWLLVNAADPHIVRIT